MPKDTRPYIKFYLYPHEDAEDERLMKIWENIPTGKLRRTIFREALLLSIDEVIRSQKNVLARGVTISALRNGGMKIRDQDGKVRVRKLLKPLDDAVVSHPLASTRGVSHQNEDMSDNGDGLPRRQVEPPAAVSPIEIGAVAPKPHKAPIAPPKAMEIVELGGGDDMEFDLVPEKPVVKRLMF